MGLMGLRFGTVATVVLLVLLRRRRPKESASGSTAITPPTPERPERPRGKPEERGRGHTDLAALLGAVVVVLLTLTSDPGAWGYTSTISSALVLCLLIAFFAAHPSSAAPNLESFIAAFVLAAVVGIAGAVTAAWPVQDISFRDDSYCRAIGVNAAANAVRALSGTELDADGVDATPAELRALVQAQLRSPVPVDDGTVLGSAFSLAYDNASGDCLADETTDHLWMVAVPLAVVTLTWWAVAYWRAARGRMPH